MQGYHKNITPHDDVQIHVVVTKKGSTVDKFIKHVRSSRPPQQRLAVSLDVEYNEGIKGIDREWPRRAALIQMCVGTECLIYQIIRGTEASSLLCDFLKDPAVEFVSVDTRYDKKMLKEGHDLEVTNHIDLQYIVLDVPGYTSRQRPSLIGIARHPIHPWYTCLQDVKKSAVRTDNWTNPFLTDEQIRYACLDAYVCYEAYAKWKRGESA
ncbi:unnamed protein product [Alopecurus aequalis]